MRALAPGRAAAQLPAGFGPLALAARLFRRRPRPRTIAALIVALLVLAGAWLWVRDSPLVSVERVTVTGAAGPDAAAIRAALETAARGMTTLDVDRAQLQAALAPYPEVKSLQITTELPHGLRIRVIEQLAVAQVAFGGRTQAVTGTGILLGSHGTVGLPRIILAVPPGGPRLTDAAALAALRALSAAPYQFLSRITHMTTEPAHGVVAQLRNGPAIYLGDGGRLHAKWLTAASVLADPGSAGAAYIDVTDPSRPAAGVPGVAPAGSTSTTPTTTAGAVATIPTTPSTSPTTPSTPGG